MIKMHLNTFCWMTLCSCWLISCSTNKDNQSSDEETEVSALEIEKRSIASELRENEHLPVLQRIALYRQLKKENPHGYNWENEDEMTMYAYSFLWNNQLTEAIEIFKLIVEQFPNSSNPYDSLGEAYLANGESELSLVNYEKSLELNLNNFHAEDQIELIKNPEVKFEKEADRFANAYTKSEYLEDLDQLGRRLTEVHPNTFKFISKDDFGKTIKEKKALITDNTTYAEFRWHCSEIVSNINCSHTSTGSFYPEMEMLPLSLRFPLQTRWINNQLFVIDALTNEDKVTIKDEIISINGFSVATLIDTIYKHIPSQGYIETAKKNSFNTWSTGLIPYALGFPKTYEIMVKGKENSIVLNTSKTFKDPMNDTSIAHCGHNLCLEFLDNNKNAVMTVSSFNYYPWNDLSVFEEFMDNSFKEINKKGAENLIIDLRFNGGGSPESSIYLLKYLVDQPFPYFSDTGYTAGKGIQEPFDTPFKGKLYFIIDGNGNSTTGHFMAMVKDLNLGTIVGEELGSNQFCTGGQTICRLRNTRLEYYVANNTSKLTITSLPDETGILPDHYITQSINEYLNSVDTVKEFTLKLINH